MKKDKLIYIMDPHCLRSYANEHAVKELFESVKDKYAFEVLPGGMWKKEQALRGGQAMKNFLQPFINEGKGLKSIGISSSYNDLIQDSSYLLSSEWPSQAIIAVKEIQKEKTLDFAHALMQQQFSNGSRYDIESTYIDAIESIDMDIDVFAEKWKSDNMNNKTKKSFRRAANLSNHFPSLVLKDKKGYIVIKTGVFRAKEVERELFQIVKKRKTVPEVA